MMYIFFRPQVYERVGILLVEVYENFTRRSIRKGREICHIWVCERANR